jgi:hypothetical protein
MYGLVYVVTASGWRAFRFIHDCLLFAGPTVFTLQEKLLNVSFT